MVMVAKLKETFPFINISKHDNEFVNVAFSGSVYFPVDCCSYHNYKLCINNTHTQAAMRDY